MGQLLLLQSAYRGQDATPAIQPSQYAWTVGDAGVIQATRTGGSAWDGQQSGTGAGLSDVTFPDASNGWAVGYGDNGYRRDAGRRRDVDDTERGTGAVLEGVVFTDATHGWAVGSYGASRDGQRRYLLESAGLGNERLAL